jgi:hypothetical protein
VLRVKLSSDECVGKVNVSYSTRGHDDQPPVPCTCGVSKSPASGTKKTEEPKPGDGARDLGDEGQQICARAAGHHEDLIVTSTHGTTGFK